MDRSPLVSVVIPAYNHAPYLDEAIRSVLEQDYPNVELLVLDDGSTDETPAILKRYGSAFHWESQPNMGQAATLNKGWGLSQGEYLAYLSADDWLYPKALSTSVAFLERHREAVLVYPDFNLVDARSRIIRRVEAPEFSYYDLVVDGVCAPGPGAVFRRSAFLAAGGWDTSLRQIPDYEYWMRLGLHGGFVRIPQVLASFRAHEASQTFAGSDRRKAEEPRRVLKTFLARSDVPNKVSKARRRAVGRATLFTATLHLRARRYFSALVRMLEALTLSPGLLLHKPALVLLWESVVPPVKLKK